MSIDVKRVRNDFPELEILVHGKPLIYLDNAASTLKCLPVINAVNNHYSHEAANIHRGVHYLSESGTIKYEETRSRIQNFINARHAHEVLFTKGTTESLNLVAQSYVSDFLTKGDEILVSTMEHHSNIVPWQIAAQRVGATVREIPINDQGEILLEEYEKMLSEKTKIVSICHISNSLGTINPIKEMIDMAHKIGSIFVVDAAQSISHEPIDVQLLDCDFLAFSSHKMFGPTGIGVLYGKEELLNKMPPYQGGGDMIDVVSFDGTTYNELPHKFEAGTPHIAGGIALKYAIDYIESLKLESIYAHEKMLLDYATEEILKIDGIKIIGTAKKKASVLAFSMAGAHPHDIGTLLDRQGVAVRTGHHCTQPLMKRMGVPATTRASFSVYNTFEDVDVFIQALLKAKELL
ncbi:aminotransferase class V-fold PLP-dependent enzyme [Bacteriovorax sp. Seq25_V]|uniref:aminotransferase class V-fold PLP-dependent enzyme n=1 Tax=Bacteriovorax sp. Seq25_V TaxID=1201288 RepID=UPI00038A19AD|nr:cysteine desulfurase [Bacteriovorax sp. Seq25_V]EQC45990.1 cysteine desulfurase, SufS family [Bacteriovorax sp. Seq25_V]